MSIIFEGRRFANQKEEHLKEKMLQLTAKKIVPKLIIIRFVGDESAKLYTELKRSAANRIGAEIDIFEITAKKGADHIIRLIKSFNADPEVHGIMIQLPFPERFELTKKKIIEAIDPQKDVDGLGDHSHYIPAVVKAVFEILHEAGVGKQDEILVVGSKGMTGKKLVQFLSHNGYAVEGVDKRIKTGTREDAQNFIRPKVQQADVVITATGDANIILSDMIKPNAVVIDIGAPKGDVEVGAAAKTLFFTPVPGGVGPVTVVSLMENLVDAATKLANQG
jgi:methylenetetrahydrofolate dehydrogenase (NADP+)/methenyltetrahydrofolate cyclohydrolase